MAVLDDLEGVGSEFVDNALRVYLANALDQAAGEETQNALCRGRGDADDGVGLETPPVLRVRHPFSLGGEFLSDPNRRAGSNDRHRRHHRLGGLDVADDVARLLVAEAHVLDAAGEGLDFSCFSVWFRHGLDYLAFIMLLQRNMAM